MVAWRISIDAGCVGSGSMAPRIHESGGTMDANSGGWMPNSNPIAI